MNKSNREKNQQHERDQILKVRPKQPAYEFTELTEVVNSWIRNRVNSKDE
jgi:hypothetical protein